MNKISPMMKQYVDMKKNYQNEILFWRLGDFYEIFYDDAIICSKELDLTLTSKNCGLEEKAPMCGIPFYTVDNYVSKLIFKGYKVAICDQVEDPKKSIGIVKREVTRIVTSGTNMQIENIDSNKNNYIILIYYKYNLFNIVISDITTGYFECGIIENKNIIDELYKYNPSEILFIDDYTLKNKDLYNFIKNNKVTVSYIEEKNIKDHINDVFNEDDFLRLKKYIEDNDSVINKIENNHIIINAINGLLTYLFDNKNKSLKEFGRLNILQNNKYLLLDCVSIKNLEILEPIFEKNKKSSLLSVLNKTKTSMGSRYMRKLILRPLINKKGILSRQAFVEELNNNIIKRDQIRTILSNIHDFERIMGKVAYGNVNPQDLILFKSSIQNLPDIKDLLNDFKSDIIVEKNKSFDVLKDIYNIINNSIKEDSNILIREGNIIKDGYSEEIDKLRYVKDNAKKLLLDIKEEEIKKTGIKNIKIKYNKIFGYFIEITKLHSKNVPSYYERRQTLANAERFVIPKLKELENTILNSQEKLNDLEYDIFCDIKDKILKNINRIRNTACFISFLDVFTTFSFIACKNNYVKPDINTEGLISIKDGRHPVVENIFFEKDFIPNDAKLDNNKNNFIFITGPNMAGKSTYMRQIALIVIMAQIGCFVPASYANISIVDKIFTRIGASDDLSTGRSTFMIEMSELSNILNNSTKNSLIILDEIGRGTSTYDGISIAFATIEYILKNIQAKTLFSTHYHELTLLESKYSNIKNYSMLIKEDGEKIIFLKKIINKPINKSYGIYVGELAGLPRELIINAKNILSILVKSKNLIHQNIGYILNDKSYKEQITINNYVENKKYKYYDEFLKYIKNIDVNNITPIESLSILNNIKNKFIKDENK